MPVMGCSPGLPVSELPNVKERHFKLTPKNILDRCKRLQPLEAKAFARDSKQGPNRALKSASASGDSAIMRAHSTLSSCILPMWCLCLSQNSACFPSTNFYILFYSYIMFYHVLSLSWSWACKRIFLGFWMVWAQFGPSLSFKMF